MKKEHWWIQELRQKEEEEALKWFKEQDRIAKHAQKEKTIIQAFQKEIRKKRDEIDQLHKEIKDLERMCDQCLAKISVGDTGLMELLVEKNSKE